MNRLQYAHVQDDGSLVFPAEVAARYGLKPGMRAVIEEGRHALVLKRPAAMLNRIYVEPTNLCNLTCATCMRNVWDEPLGRMTADTYACILDGLRPFSPPPTVFFGGFGEPLFHPGIVEMVAAAKTRGCCVELITNGILLDETMAAGLLKAGLDFLWVSVDGATPQSYQDVRLGDSLPLVLDNVRALRSLRDRIYSYTPQLGFAFVAMRRNVQDLPEVIHTGLDLGVRRFSISNVLAHTPELRRETLYDQALYHSAQLTTDAVARISLPRMDWTPQSQDALMQVLSGNYQINFGDGEAPRLVDTCPFVERGSTSVRWDGEVSSCLALLHTHDTYLDDRVRRSNAYSFGNLRDQSLAQIWESEAYLGLRETLQAFAFAPCVVCNSCEMANDNLEDCFGNALPTCGGCLWAQGLIQCP